MSPVINKYDEKPVVKWVIVERNEEVQKGLLPVSVLVWIGVVSLFVIFASLLKLYLWSK
ncbi:hypothetical protein ACIQXI_05760 [Lysinibacillus sp. NPDC097195]|uniref:hypothetical protein n=1 Tax=Lysinibacillus sp. NPDC097195 TaxID=3364141 RepID=UPI003820D4DB